MRLVNNQHEVLRCLRHGVRHRLPKGILPFVAALCKALVLAEQLRVDEVNMARMQTLFIETFAVDRNHAVIREIVGRLRATCFGSADSVLASRRATRTRCLVAL